MALSIGICTNFLGEDRYSLQTERYPEISRVFDYVELPAMTVTALSDPEFDALRAELEKVGLRCPVMTNLFPADIPLAFTVAGCRSAESRIWTYCFRDAGHLAVPSSCSAAERLVAFVPNRTQKKDIRAWRSF